jgi:hypothetical protein
LTTRFLWVPVQRDCDERLIISKIKEVKLEKFHRLLGHTSIYTRQATAKKLEMKIIGNFKHCEDCKKIEEIQSLQVGIATTRDRCKQHVKACDIFFNES